MAVDEAAPGVAAGASHTPWLGIFCGVGVSFIWAGWVVVSRFGVQQTLTIYDVSGLRYGLAALIVLPWVIRRGFFPEISLSRAVLLAALTGVPFLLFSLAGLQFAPAADASVIMNGGLPLLTALAGAALLGERPGWRRLLGIALILAGVLMIAAKGIGGFGGAAPDAWQGHLLILIATILIGAYMMLSRAWGVAALTALAVVPLVNAVLFVPLWLVALPSRLAEAPWSEIALQGGYQALGPSIFGLLMYTKAATELGAARASAFMALVPPLTLLMGIPALGEWPSPLQLGGIVVVTLGILFAATGGRAR